jgi:hypothetical protein
MFPMWLVHAGGEQRAATLDGLAPFQFNAWPQICRYTTAPPLYSSPSV